MKQVEITNGLMRIETNTESFDMQKIENRRFMYNPHTGTLLLGVQFSANSILFSHAEEFHRLGMRKDFDEYVRGWIGVGKGYEQGVIHFAPAVPTSIPDLFNKGYDTLLMFRKNNGKDKTVVRGFGRTWEQPLSNIITEREVNSILTDKTSINMATDETAELSGVTVHKIELTGKTQKEKVAEITAKLEQGIKNLFDSDKFKEYLSAMSKFHHYSFRNTLLIVMQKPDASMVAGYTGWQKNFKRQVKKGEHGIKIFSPAPYKTTKEIKVIGKDGKTTKEEREITVPAYKIATVFDVSQTEGEPIPSLGVDELSGDIKDFKKLLSVLEKISPVPIGFEDIESGAKGYFNNEEKRIAVQIGMSDVQTLKTLIHEIAHSKLHAYDDINKIPPEQRKDRHTKEVEAESVAYTVCQHYGIDTSDYTFGYVAGWSSGKELPELKSSLATIQHTANEIISGIDEHLAELTKDKDLSADEQAQQDGFEDLPDSEAEEAAKLFEQQEQAADEREEKAETEQKAAVMAAAAVITEYKGWEFDGGHVEPNKDADRLRVFFNDKPDEDTRKELKDNGFKWAPKVGAWQSPLTDNVFYSADNIKSIQPSDGTKPSQLQNLPAPIPPKQNKKVAAELPVELSPEIQPVVTVIWSESPELKDGEKMSLYQADSLFERLDKEYPEHSGYDKTKFRIDFTYKGQECSYEGRYDLGDKENGIIDHIEKFYRYYRTNEYEQGQLASQGVDVLAEHNQQYDMMLNEIIPYFRLHNSFSEIETAALIGLCDKNISDEQLQYYAAALNCVAESRTELNNAQGAYNLPEMPKPPQTQTQERTDIPTMAELEHKAKSGEPVSLMDIAAAAKKEKSAEKKPSIRQQLKDGTSKSEPKKAAPVRKKEGLSI